MFNVEMVAFTVELHQVIELDVQVQRQVEAVAEVTRTVSWEAAV